MSWYADPHNQLFLHDAKLLKGKNQVANDAGILSKNCHLQGGAVGAAPWAICTESPRKAKMPPPTIPPMPMATTDQYPIFFSMDPLFPNPFAISFVYVKSSATFRLICHSQAGYSLRIGFFRRSLRTQNLLNLQCIYFLFFQEQCRHGFQFAVMIG